MLEATRSGLNRDSASVLFPQIFGIPASYGALIIQDAMQQNDVCYYIANDD